MTVKCIFNDGTTGLLNNVMWHPKTLKVGEPCDASLWMFAKDANEMLEEAYGKDIDDIISAEAPLEFYWHCDDEQPWNHFGLRVKDVKATSNNT